MDPIIDLSSWMGKPPENPNPSGEQDEQAHSDDSGSHTQTASSVPDGSDSDGDILHDDQDSPKGQSRVTIRLGRRPSSPSETENGPAPGVAPSLRQSFYVEVPKLPDEDKQEYEYLPGHFSVQRILSKSKKGRYLVKLDSGEVDLVSSRELLDLENGSLALEKFKSNSSSNRDRRDSQKPGFTGMVDWNTVELSGSDEKLPASRPRHKAEESDVSEDELAAESSDEDEDEDEDEEVTDGPQAKGRRSARLTKKKKTNYFKQDLIEIDDDDDSASQPRRRSTRRTTRLQPTRGGSPSLRSTRSKAYDSLPEPEMLTRRSVRNGSKPRRSMRERQEDDISSYEEEKAGPKIVGTKEYFARVPEQDPFRRRHRQECDICYFKGDDAGKGPLVFCQGCTNSYHKACLGPRGSRDHLVTKVGDSLFVLQCRRCIGLAHDRDKRAPHHGVCVGCNILGELSKPLRNRLTTRQEQAQREENGGTDPITIVEPKLINNVAHVLFRCAQCFRAWHMHHLPARQTADSSLDDEEEDLDEAELAQKRFEHYHRSWMCKDCIEHQNQIDVLVAWRPVDLEAYVPGTTVEQMEEHEKEYLVKWKAQSYFRTNWMPGAWVWGTAASSMRLAFFKKLDNQLPKMTTADALPEEVFRVDIVFDVRYTSVVRNSTKEIDLARVKEVDMAYVKYKGLGYEDAIWEKPPPYTDTERWNDFKEAYEDYVKKLHLSIPPQASLRRHLQHIQAQDFESNLIKKTQPSIMSGGELMLYQLEGLNWLMYQWFSNQNAILADEMGLGKTIQLVAFFATLVQDHKCWPFLVVVPNSTVPNWRREIKKWAPSLRVVTYFGSSTARKLIHDYELFPKLKDDESHHQQKKSRSEVRDIKAHIVVTSYESITEEKTRLSLMKIPWQGLFVDEGQRLKSDRSQIYDILSKFKFPFKVLLTGTPLQNNARELFNLLQFLDKTMVAADLEAKYASLTQDNVPELHQTLRKFFLRRTKAQVLTFLPPMAQVIIPVSMSTVQKKVYKSILARNPQLMKSIFSQDRAVASKERMNLNNILMQLRKTLCHPFVYSRDIEERGVDPTVAFNNLVQASGKLQLLSIMLPKLQERGHRVLMFSQFLDNLDVVEDFLDGLGLQHRRLDGNISSVEKQKRIDEFNAPNSPYFAFLLSTRAGGVGINLATADTVIILDPDFNPHQDIQALSRAHRIGQKNKVLVFQLMTRNSAEEKIMQIGRKKMALDHVLIERMDKDDDAGEDLESILKHGAQALFEDESGADDIVYDSTSVDRLLDRSQIENTKISEEKSAESQFSFARVWQNDKAALEDEITAETVSNTPNPGIWDKILAERERMFAEEQARKAEAFGRGKRRRQTVDYALEDDGEKHRPSSKGRAGSHRPGPHDDDYQAPVEESHDDEISSESDAKPNRTVQARPFKRVRVPLGPAPHFNGDAQFDFGPVCHMPPTHLCSACGEEHPMGWCRLKLAGLEYCGLCGLAHLGHGRTCPHLNDEAQVATMIQTLKESTEGREVVEHALKYLRMVRGDLLSRKRARERKELEALEKQRRQQQSHQQPPPPMRRTMYEP
ncbi:hypothetical protein A1O1_03202 [Capronia coronata CBS 617.96]|uniref:Adenosinetriphosphatase n=1 Tax=Capronia coronata CBS 617.96 TaxID=1182541 RepID=W9ZJU5_9EURO|nr:uncharacterized protein A1O1_03202 [Capronia coronata CBS 617.96]EXJ94804.1 hypothetical protein A1O1_03202 [Capronia coronata CBS 617.96]